MDYDTPPGPARNRTPAPRTAATVAEVPRNLGSYCLPLSRLAPTVERAQAYAEQARSGNTRRAYASQWAAFRAWCAETGAPIGRAETVALYLTARADDGASVATVAQALAAISQAFQCSGVESPRQHRVVREVWRGIRRSKGTAPSRQAAPLLPSQLRTLSRALPDTLAGKRDRALLLMGFAAALRRSELVALNQGDVRATRDGLTVTIRRSKTDQEGQGRKVGVPFGSDPASCPVRAWGAWLEASGIERGAVFVGLRSGKVGKRLHGRDVSRIIKRAATRVGVEPAELSGHSLRSGLVTAAAQAGKSVGAIQAQTGHRSAAMVLRYYREATLFSDNAASGIGL